MNIYMSEMSARLIWVELILLDLKPTEVSLCAFNWSCTLPHFLVCLWYDHQFVQQRLCVFRVAYSWEQTAFLYHVHKWMYRLVWKILHLSLVFRILHLNCDMFGLTFLCHASLLWQASAITVLLIVSGVFWWIIFSSYPLCSNPLFLDRCFHLVLLKSVQLTLWILAIFFVFCWNGLLPWRQFIVLWSSEG